MSPSWTRLWPTIPMWTSVKWGDLTLVVVKVFSVSLTWPDVVIVLMVLIVETGISLMELDWSSLIAGVISLSNVLVRELTYVVGTVLTHQLVSIAVIFQLMLSMMILTSQ